MRGFTKAAALLSLSRAATFVIPESSAPLANPIIEYQPQNALVKFEINVGGESRRLPPFSFQVEGTSKACGESNILLNGLKLDSQWDGITAKGRNYLDVFGGQEAEWYIRCLFNEVPADGSNSKGEDVVHVLSLRIGSSIDGVQPGFTISYRQLDQPAVLRLDLRYRLMKLFNDHKIVDQWRTLSTEFSPGSLHVDQEHLTPFGSQSIRQGQKALGTYFRALTGSLKKEVQEVIKHFCPRQRAEAAKQKALKPLEIPLDRLLEPPPAFHGEDISKADVLKSTNTVSTSPASQTRSLASPEALNPSTTTVSAFPSSPPTNRDLHFLKIFALVLVLGSCFAWICLRCRDPRRRAECLARREERRNKKLYRRAARQHKVKMWFWNFRLRYGLAPSKVLSWDEKRTRVIQQEAILEDAMTSDIRALRNAHRVVGTITAAEEGRNAFAYAEGSHRRQSVSTLPGYESEGSQPPTYDDVSGSLEGTTVVNGFQYSPAETEFRSDSSVISTSTRISRDGTNSDFDEKFEPISLEANGPAGSGYTGY